MSFASRWGGGVASMAIAFALLTDAGVAMAQPASAQVAEQAPQTRAERVAARRAARQARREQRLRAREVRRSEATADGRRVEGSPAVEGGDIIVTGIRQSVKESIDRKRNARQIVDVVTAEDAGKLPDNNVVEAMARITGITVTRGQGRANGYNIRGLAGVQTTVNGVEGATAPTPGGEGRTLALESLPAELIKSVEVYKTRTADQIEGGIGGSVNVELRRPLDLRKGWTVAGSYRDQYGEQGKLWSPSGSLLVANRFETGIGEMGFLLNGAYSKPKYQEAYNYTESPFFVGCDTCTIRQSLPADQRDTLVAPYKATYGLNSGEREQKSLSGALQWRANSRLNFVLEGSYVGENSTDEYNALYLLTREDYYTLRNLRISPNGALLGYDILNLPGANGQTVNFGKIGAGVDATHSEGKTSTYRTNFETHYEAPGLRIDGSTQYQWSRNSYYSNGHVATYNGLTTARIDFDAPEVENNGPYFKFNVSPTDPSLARIQALRDNIGSGKNSQFSSQVDIWKELDPQGLARAFKFGARYARNTFSSQSSYRFAGWFDPTRQPLLSAIPGVDAVTVTPQLPGGSPLSWIQLDSGQLYNNWANVTKFIIANNPEALDGPGRENGVASLFGTERPSASDIVYTSNSRENIFAAYGTLDYGFKAGFPVDGNLGLRYVNTWAKVQGRSLQLGPPLKDASGNTIPGQFGPDTQVEDNVRGNYVDLLPSAFATMHFTDKLQLRGSYSHNVQRPGLFDLRSTRIIDYRNPGSPVYAGNPELKPTTTDDYNLSLEYYFGRGGILSLTAFSKNQKGFIYYTRQQEFVPELGGLRDVFQPRNAGPGQTQGLEFQATGFFSFLPGFLRNFGATANATWIPTADIKIPGIDSTAPDGTVTYELVRRRAPFTSKWSYNLIGYYETAMLSARLAYNWRSRYQTGVDAINETYIISSRATSRLDAAINFTPVKFLTFSIEGQNLLNAVDKNYYYLYPELPTGLRAMGRTITGGVRFRF